MAENLKIMGTAYEHKNNFKEAKHCLELALSRIFKLDSKIKKELEAAIYGALASLYSTTYLNKIKAYQAEKYALKALVILNASKLFSNKLEKSQEKISCTIAEYRMLLGRIYSRLGKYDDALTQVNEAEYIVTFSLNQCFNPLLIARILFDRGEISLRRGKLNDAEEELTKSIRMRETLVGKFYSSIAKIHRAETKLRLGKLTEAYEDCSVVFKKDQTIKNHQNISQNFSKILNFFVNPFSMTKSIRY